LTLLLDLNRIIIRLSIAEGYSATCETRREPSRPVHPISEDERNMPNEAAGLSTDGIERPIGVKAAARFLGVSPSLVYAYVERKQIPHFRMMGRSIRFRLSELVEWRQQFHVNGESNE
jgi:excisionase family DNA binding protein